MKFFCNLFLISLVDSLMKLSSCTNKIGAVVTSYFMCRTSTSHEAAKCLKEGVCVEGIIIQYRSHSFARTCPWPSCLCMWRMISVVTWLFWGRITGCLDSSGMSAWFNQPATRSRPPMTNRSRRWRELVLLLHSLSSGGVSVDDHAHHSLLGQGSSTSYQSFGTVRNELLIALLLLTPALLVMGNLCSAC